MGRVKFRQEGQVQIERIKFRPTSWLLGFTLQGFIAVWMQGWGFCGPSSPASSNLRPSKLPCVSTSNPIPVPPAQAQPYHLSAQKPLTGSQKGVNWSPTWTPSHWSSPVSGASSPGSSESRDQPLHHRHLLHTSPVHRSSGL